MNKRGQDYIVNHPHMMKMWSKNNTLDPNKQSAGSAKKALWVCDLGHEWSARILNIKHGSGCCYCNNNKVLKGFNDLQTKFPEIAKLFDEELNNLKADEVVQGSSNQYWFKCENYDHFYLSKIERLKRNRRCSYCAGKKVLKGFNDFPTTAPQLLEWWDYSKNDKNPSELSKGSHKNSWWICPKNKHSFQRTVLSLYKNTACGYCSNQVILTGYNDMATLRPEFLEWWDYDKNTLNPSEISPFTHKKFWVKCQLGHSWETNGDKMSSGYRCPYCNKNRVLKGFNDLATKNPETLKYWNYNKNIVHPTEVTSRSKKKVWWKCKEEHEWEAIIGDIASGKSKCPICSNHKILLGYNDLLTHCPDIIKHWSPHNKKLPEEYTFGAGYIVELICPEDGSFYKKEIFNFVKHAYPFCACPNCTPKTSSFEKSVNQFIQKDLQIDTITSNRQIIKPYEIDIVIESKKIAIECNGVYWHSDDVIQKSRNMSAKNFHQLKKDLAKDAGYDLFFVWENDWKHNKEIIEQELENILNNNYENINLLNCLE